MASAQPTIVRDPELAAVLAELQRARDSLIRIEELLNKPIDLPPSSDWGNNAGMGKIPRAPEDWDNYLNGVPRSRKNRNWGWWWQR